MVKNRTRTKDHSLQRFSWKLLDTLASMGKKGDSYEDVVWRLIKENAESVSE